MDKKTQSAFARFFVRIGQVGQGPWKDERTLPLFSLALIMDAEGVLAREARHLTERAT